MGLLLLGEKRTQDTHSEWLSSSRTKKKLINHLSRESLDPHPTPPLGYNDNLVFTLLNPKPSRLGESLYIPEEA